MLQDIQLLNTMAFFAQWTLPNDPDWSETDGDDIRRFHNTYVQIKSTEFSFNSRHADNFLQLIYPRLKAESQSYPGIILNYFIRQGSSREGLKVSHADEFDVVVPFEFSGVTTKVLVKNEPQFRHLPPGYAQIELVEVSDEFRRKYPKLIKKVGRKELLDTKYLHDTIFKGMVDKMLLKLASDDPQQNVSMGFGMGYSGPFLGTYPGSSETTTQSGRNQRFGSGSNFKTSLAEYEVFRKSSAPAIILEVNITDEKQRDRIVIQKISIDLVPGYVDQSNHKFLISKWMPESRRVTLSNPITDSETATTIWKLSFYENEVGFIFQHRGQRSSENLIAAFRILKGLRNAELARHPSSQYANVFSSYYLKNILLYSLLFEPKIRAKHAITSVTEALGCLIGMVRLVLDVKNLPKFFISNPLLREIYPYEDFHKGNMDTRMNILQEYTSSLPQVKRDFNLAIQYFRIPDFSDTVQAKVLCGYFQRHITIPN